MAKGGEEAIPSRGPAWQYEPLVVHVYGRFQTTPSIHLRLAPVFFNPRTFASCYTSKKSKL